MSARAALAGLLAALALAVAACGGQSGSDADPTITQPPASPDGVAAAFSAAWAAGDTPAACKYTSGRAKENMTEGGAASLCSHSAWPAQGYWLADQCVLHDTDYIYIYRASGPVGGGDSFVITVTGAEPFYTVTSYAAGSYAVAGGICATAEAMMTSTAAVPS